MSLFDRDEDFQRLGGQDRWWSSTFLSASARQKFLLQRRLGGHLQRLGGMLGGQRLGLQRLGGQRLGLQRLGGQRLCLQRHHGQRRDQRSFCRPLLGQKHRWQRLFGGGNVWVSFVGIFRLWTPKLENFGSKYDKTKKFFSWVFQNLSEVDNGSKPESDIGSGSFPMLFFAKHLSTSRRS